MRSTLNLKAKSKNGESLIYLKAYFKNEGKKFVYSTGETIDSKDWDLINKQPNNLNGRTAKAENQRAIKIQLDRYSNFFTTITNWYKTTKQEITIEAIRIEFDKEFKKVNADTKGFFAVYDKFLLSKETDQTNKANSHTTIKRYEYNKKLLQDFEKESKKKLTFNNINQDFYNAFISYCRTTKEHSENTLSRNIGLLKTFLYWAIEKGYTYKLDFKKFKNIKKVVTDEVALTLDQVIEIFEFDFSNNKRLERTRDLFVFGCFTGMRYSNYSKIKKTDIENGFIKVRDVKDKTKLLSIPLNDYSKFILKKYDYKLPKISNQKFNDYIKDVIEEIGYTQDVKKTSMIGKKEIETITPFYKRISSHTARRSFITIMKTQKVPDKIIMGYTGHKSLEIFNMYYKPNIDEKADFMHKVFTMNNSLLKKVE